MSSNEWGDHSDKKLQSHANSDCCIVTFRQKKNEGTEKLLKKIAYAYVLSNNST